jgi:hypothetical protein
MARSLVVVGAMTAAALPACTTNSEQTEQTTTDPGAEALAGIPKYPHKALCDGSAAPGTARCYAHIRTDSAGNVQPAAAPQGYGPADLKSAYKLPSSGGSGMTVAIVDAQDSPNAESDLATYRSQYGLPACTTANGCFKKVNQSGQQSNYPSPDPGWAGEIALDLDMVSAVCPSCKIILVEANSASMDDLGASVNTAVSLGANAVSNSYGGPEDNTVSAASSSYFNHPGVLITAATGDNGFGTSFPASSQYVLAVGGTSLTQDTSARGWAEGAWNGGGSGCSAYIPKPSWQKDTGCSMRMVADVSAVADPNTGLATYDSYGSGGWVVVGGTSASTPIIAAIFALTGHLNSGPSWPYAHTSDFYDITSGNNGTCSPSYECTAGPGYDGPTGLGTPNASTFGTVSPSDAGVVDSGVIPDSGVKIDAGTPDSGVTTPDSGVKTDAGTPDSGVKADAGAPDAGGTGGTCSHPICSAGNHLTSSCDPCATEVCGADPYCCAVQWDSICVSEVSSICGKSCTGGGGGGGSCQHPICSSGGKLTSTCSPCATDICSQDPYCCAVQWDSICVSEVGSICGQSC